MSLNPLNQLLEDKTQNRYMFVLYVLTILFGLPAILCMLAIPGTIFISSGNFDQLLSLSFCSCLTYPVAVAFGLGTAWYSLTKKRYTLILLIMLIPLCNLLVALFAIIAGY